MCGLVGVAGDLNARDQDVFLDGLWANALRGMHSTGTAFISERRQISVVKKPGSPMQIWGEKEFTSKLRDWNTRVLLGHNRYATVGEHTQDNAHPFQFSDIVGAHNGTLDYRARRVLVDHEKFGTDSEALYHNINEFGVDEVIPEMSGAWALTWYNRANHTINFLRNDQRPLYYTFSEAGDVMYWASEKMMLAWILSRRQVRHGPVCELNPNVWVSFVVAGTRTKFGEPRTQEVKGWVAPPFVPVVRPRGKEEESPWGDESTDGQELQGVLNQWPQTPLRLGPPTIGPGTHEKGSPVMDDPSLSTAKKDGALPKKNVRAKKQNVHGGLPGLPKGTKSPSTSIEDGPSPETKASLDLAWEDGFCAGGEAKSKTACPFPKGTNHYEQWQQGRLAGFETYSQGTRRPSPADGGEPLKIKAYSAEWIDETEFMRRTGGRCEWSGCDVEFTEPLEWLSREACVCKSCVSGNKLLRELLGKAKAA